MPAPTPSPKNPEPDETRSFKRLTQRDLARALKLSQATVSLALRNHPSIPEATRAKVLALSKELCYEIDPALVALAAYRQRIKPAAFHGNLVWLTNWPTRDGWKFWMWRDTFEGARRRARELGYSLEECWLREPSNTHARIAQMLQARGISGIILPPQADSHVSLEFGAWEKFAVVSIGYSLVKPLFNMVIGHQYMNMLLLLQQLRRLGYRRPGLALEQEFNSRTRGAWSAAYGRLPSEWPEATPLPILEVDGLANRRGDLMSWVGAQRPDLIITMPNVPGEAWLNQAGIAVPQDMGLAFVSIRSREARSGMYESFTDIGRATAELLVSMINQGERGIPEKRRYVLVEGVWNPGRTVRPMSP